MKKSSTHYLRIWAPRCRAANRLQVFFLIFFLLLSVVAAKAQTTPVSSVSGQVTDAAGLGLPGVSVKEKDQKSGTSTNAEGKFTLKLTAANPTIVISYLGYKPRELRVGQAGEFLKIELEESVSELNQVVIVGYGTKKKGSVIGSVAQIEAKELRSAPTANLSSMLQGRLPGLVTKQASGQPGSDGASLLVRGYSTLGNNSPLVVVDGIEREFPSVNPDEIESVTVLKDAASSAVYGVRAANGVILITTKRGTNQKPTINYTSSLALSSNTNFPEFLNGPEYAYWYNKAQEMDGVSEAGRRFTADEISRITNGDPQGIYGNTNWFDMLFKSHAPIYTNNLSISGGSDKYKYFVSLGSYNQEGIINRTSYDRYNVRANFDANITPALTASINLALKDDNTKQPGLSAGVGNAYASIFSQAMMSYPFLPAYNAAGMPVGSLNPDNGNQNPLAARDHSGLQQSRGSGFQGSFSLKYDLPAVKGLSFKMNAAYDKGYTLNKSYLLPYLLSVYNSSTRTYSEAYARHVTSADGAILSQGVNDTRQATLQPSITFDRKFNKHSVNALFLYEYMRADYGNLSGGREGYPITDIMDLKYGDIIKSASGGHGMFDRAGLVGRLSYDYANKYLVELSNRYDATPKLPESTRWGFFPAVSVGWRLSEEGFFKKMAPFVDDFKLRASVGKLGNDRIPDHQYVSTVNVSGDPVVVIGDKLGRGLYTGSFPNANITWESTTSYDAGFESSMWNSLLGVEANVFYKVTKDILQSQTSKMPPSLGGYYAGTVNSGVVDSRGVELVLNHRNQIGKLNYFMKGNFAWARSKVIETTEDPNIPDHLRKTGKPVGLKYGFVADGLYQSQEEIDNSALFGPARVGDVKLKDLNGDGRITWDQDWTVIGKSDLPEIMFGFNMGADYKGFDFNVFFQGAAKSDIALSGYYDGTDGIYDNTFYTRPFYQDGNSPKYLVENSWTPENTKAKYPRLSTITSGSGGKFSSFWIQDGAYLRLKSAQLGYTLPTVLTKKIGLQKVRLSVSGSNLFTLSGLDYLDPEMPSVNQGYYPQQKLYEFGLNVTL